VDRAVAIDRELLVRPAPQRTTLGHALNLLTGAALRFRDRFGVAVPGVVLIGSFAHRPAPRARPRRAAEIRVRPGPASMPPGAATIELLPTPPF